MELGPGAAGTVSSAAGAGGGHGRLGRRSAGPGPGWTWRPRNCSGATPATAPLASVSARDVFVGCSRLTAGGAQRHLRGQGCALPAPTSAVRCSPPGPRACGSGALQALASRSGASGAGPSRALPGSPGSGEVAGALPAKPLNAAPRLRAASAGVHGGGGRRGLPLEPGPRPSGGPLPGGTRRGRTPLQRPGLDPRCPQPRRGGPGPRQRRERGGGPRVAMRCRDTPVNKACLDCAARRKVCLFNGLRSKSRHCPGGAPRPRSPRRPGVSRPPPHFSASSARAGGPGRRGGPSCSSCPEPGGCVQVSSPARLRP